ncbi:serine/threonine-protein kinase [Actinomadura hibisca]|uniref:serine/threonine-protein kinase n=1 Tax=Actinomadura hibisca TaxID=68565 RepID=UPI001FE1AC48|nr:serine/threonine-protein kinase [Actinomadura hibisca]
MDVAGWRVSGYTEVRRLGAGGQGEVVLVRHDASGAPAAVKYLSAGAGDQERERLRHEAAMLAQADSPHVARLYRLVESEHGIALVMEAVDGVSLKEILERHDALGPEASLTVLKGALLGLAAAHHLGVVHRDFKPANVVVPADGRSKLVDFGIAVPAGQAAGGAGTAFYMAPEQWAQHVATPATDVYAATCVFVECVTGRRPFTGNRAELRAAHLAQPVPLDGVPAPLHPLVAHGTAKDPAERPLGAAVFVDELERTARAAYGPDWEDRGIRALAGAAVALAALFPLTALFATAPTVGAGAGAGTGAAATAGKGFLATVGGKVVAGVGAAVVVTGGAVAVQQIATGETPPPRPSPTVKAAAFTPVRDCQVSDLQGTKPPGPKPAPVRLPEQVRLPADAAVYETDAGHRMIGQARAACERSTGVTGGSRQVSGAAGTGWVAEPIQFSVGNLASMTCQYFPNSPEAAAQRRTGTDCTTSLRARQNIASGVPGVRAMLGGPSSDDFGERPPSPYIDVVMGAMLAKDRPAAIQCTLPAAQAGTCVAALTYWYVQVTGEKGKIAKADLDRIAAQIAAFVPKARR